MSNRTNVTNPANQIKLIITMDAQGRVQVTGPIHDPLVCYGLLEFAKQTVAEFQRQGGKLPDQPQIEVATPADLEANGITIADKRT